MGTKDVYERVASACLPHDTGISLPGLQVCALNIGYQYVQKVSEYLVWTLARGMRTPQGVAMTAGVGKTNTWDFPRASTGGSDNSKI